MKKILIFYGSYGGGHISAARNIKEYFETNNSDCVVSMIDCVEYTNKIINKITTKAYSDLSKYAHWLWRRVYNSSEDGWMSSFSNFFNRLMANKLYTSIEEFNPDIIISTHPFSSQMVSYLKRKGKLNCTLATIMTDFAMHKQWLIGHEYTEYFFISNEDMKQDIINYGVSPDKIFVTGIPMSDRFFENFDVKEVYEMFELDANKKVILFFGGGEFGLGKNRTTQILQAFIQKASNYQIVAVAGKNEKMKESFEQLVHENNAKDRVRVLGFTDKVPELMHISSLVVTKPGGLTTTESLASNLPMIIINPIPGQEEENAEFLVSHGVGVWIKKEDNPEEVIINLLSSNLLEEMKKNTEKFTKQYSTKTICETLL